jgi:hypothetical protein
MLFRGDHSPDPNASQGDVARIFARALSTGDLPAPDKSYVAQVVASRTGLNQQDAEKRVGDVYDQAKAAAAQAADKAKQAAEVARKTGVYIAFWTFIALLVGAFSASFMATVGGHARDNGGTRNSRTA